MLRRRAEHDADIMSGNGHKYRILLEAMRAGHELGMFILYISDKTTAEDIAEDIGK